MESAIFQGDCLDQLRRLPDDSIDAVVTDPPYGLSAQPDIAEVLGHWLAGDDYEHRGSGFMGKSWDSFVPGPKVWKECYRVLKPGGHLLAFFGTRTYDLGAIAVRLAGFEVRDCLAWAYGSGFPKSLNVSKAIDKAAGAERKVVGYTNPHDPRTAMARKMYGTDLQDGAGRGTPITEAATDEAQEWAGWGTALKPAFEPIILARKPLIRTVAENVTRYGTGGLNVDGCRVEGAKGDGISDRRRGEDFQGYEGGWNDGQPGDQNPSGRWPANLILDAEAGAIIDKQAGENPSRFFCAKANSREKNAGLGAAFEVKRPDHRDETAAGHFHEKGIQPQKNAHPTVKPIDLMRWLCRLVTPPGGTILDPFVGSGTTAIAAHLEGFGFVGIEQDEDYIRIAEARIEWWGQYSGETGDILKGTEPPRKRQRDVSAPTLFDS